jgi:hypothetical protein
MLRLRNSKTTNLGGRKYAIDAFIGAVQMSEDGIVWQDIKPSLVRDKDRWHVEGAPYYAEIKDDGTRLFCPDRNEKSRYFRLPNSSLLAPLDKSVRSTPAKLDGQLLPNQILMPYNEWADITVGFTNTGMTFSVLFKEAPPVQFEEKFTFDAEAAGLDISQMLLEKKEVGIPRPRLIDSKVDREVRWLDWTFKEGQLELGFDLSGLVYPVLLKNVTIDEEVGASTDDAHENENGGGMDLTSEYVLNASGVNAWDRRWGGYRFELGSSIPQGSTISAAYWEAYVPYGGSYDDANFNIHFEKAVAPATFSSSNYDISGRTRTTNSVAWVQDDVGSGAYRGSAYSLVTPLQEVIDAYTASAIAVITRPNQDTAKILYTWAYDHGSYPAKLHIEYIEGGGGGTPNRGWWSK